MAKACPVIPGQNDFKKTARDVYPWFGQTLKSVIWINAKSADLLTLSTKIWPQIVSFHKQIQWIINTTSTDRSDPVTGAQGVLSRIEDEALRQVNNTSLWRSWSYFQDIADWARSKINGLSWDKASNEVEAIKILNSLNWESSFDNPITMYSFFKYAKTKEMYIEVTRWISNTWNEVFGDPIYDIPTKTKEKILYILAKNNNIVQKWTDLALGMRASARRAVDKFSNISAVVSFSRHFWPLALLSTSLPMTLIAYWVMFAPSLFRAYNLRIRRTTSASRKDASSFAKRNWFVWRWNWSARDRLRSKWFWMLNWVGIDNIVLDSFYMKEAIVTLADKEWKSIEQLELDMNQNTEYKNLVYNAIYEIYMWYSWQEIYKNGETSLTALGRLTSVMSKFWMVNLKYWLRHILFWKTKAQKAYANALESWNNDPQWAYVWYITNNFDIYLFYQELFQWLAWAFRLSKIADDMDDEEDEENEDGFRDAFVNTKDILTNNGTFMALAMSNTRLRLVYDWLFTALKAMGIWLNDEDKRVNEVAGNVWVDGDDIRFWKYIKSIVDQLFFRAAQPFVSIAQSTNAYNSSWSKEKALDTLISSYFWAMSNFIWEIDWISYDTWFETPLGDKWLLHFITGKRLDESYWIVEANKAGLEWSALTNNWWFIASILYWLEKSKIFWAADYRDIKAPTNLKNFIEYTKSDSSLMAGIAKWDITWFSVEALSYAHSQYTKLTYEDLKKWLSVKDWELVHTYESKWQVYFSDESKKFDAFDSYLWNIIWEKELLNLKKTIEENYKKSPEKDKALSSYVTTLMAQAAAKEKWAANSSLVFAAFLETVTQAAIRAEWFVTEYWKTMYETTIPKEALANIKADVMKKYWWAARLIDADSFASVVVYEAGNKNPDLRPSIKWFVPWLWNMYSKAELNYWKYDAMYDSFVLWINEVAKWDLSWLWYMTTATTKFYDMLSKYPEQSKEIKEWMLKNILVMKNYYEDRWMTDKAIVNATVPFFANNQDVLSDYFKWNDTPENKKATMWELYDLYDKIDNVNNLSAIKNSFEEASWKWKWYSSSNKYKNWYRTYMEDVGENLPFKNSYLKFQSRYNKDLQYAADNYAKKIYSRQNQQYNQQERKFLNARAYYKPAISQYPADERFSPTTGWFQTYLKQQWKFKSALSDDITLFPRLTKKTSWPQIGKSLQSTVRKSRIYNSNASSAARSR